MTRRAAGVSPPVLQILFDLGPKLRLGPHFPEAPLRTAIQSMLGDGLWKTVVASSPVNGASDFSQR